MKSKNYKQYWDNFDEELYKKFVKTKHNFKRLTKPKSMEELRKIRLQQWLAGMIFNNNN